MKSRQTNGKEEEKWSLTGRWSSILLLSILTLACLLPFLDKAFNIDDPLFIWSAQHIQTDPVNFYGFNVNWEGREACMADMNQNPPLTAYYLALVGSLFGWSEIALHAGFLVPALALVLGTYFLARSLGAAPLVSGLATISTPVFLLSSTSVMCDTMMTALWVWSVFCWIEGLKRNKPLLMLGFAGILITACCLTKYFGISLIPLLLIYSVIERRAMGTWLVYLLIPVLFLGCYQWLTHKLYGRGLLLDAAAYATMKRVGGDWLSKIVSGLAFTGGGMIVLLAAAPLLWGKRMLLAGIAAVAIAMGLLIGLKELLPFPVIEAGRIHWLFVVQAALFIVAGASILLLAALDLIWRKSTISVLLFLWVLGVFIFTSIVNWTVSGRNILPMLPAVVLLLVRRLELRCLLHKHGILWRLILPFCGSLLIAMLVTWADCRLANSARATAGVLKQNIGAEAGTMWFEGHWGFQYYMEKRGGKAIDKNNLHLVSNDAIIVPLGNSFLFSPPSAQTTPWTIYDSAVPDWLTTMSADAGAGYYSASWGPLPFVFSRVPPDRYLVFHVK